MLGAGLITFDPGDLQSFVDPSLMTPGDMVKGMTVR
jgi:hypothetical protein